MAKKVILLVEDNPDDVFLTQRALNKSNIANELIIAKDGVEAIQYLFGEGKYVGRDITQLPEVVLLDLKMPRMDGIQVLQRIRTDERTKFIPVVVLTSSQEEQDIVQSYKFGANSYVRKPIDFNQFHKAILDLGLYWLVLNITPNNKG